MLRDELIEQHTKATWEYDWVTNEGKGIREIIVERDNDI
jgi:hypothetical protein